MNKAQLRKADKDFKRNLKTKLRQIAEHLNTSIAFVNRNVNHSLGFYSQGVVGNITLVRMNPNNIVAMLTHSNTQAILSTKHMSDATQRQQVLDKIQTDTITANRFAQHVEHDICELAAFHCSNVRCR